MLAHYYEQQYELPSVGLLDFDNLHRENPAVPKIFFTHGNYLADYTRHHDSKADFYDRKVLLLVRDPRDIAVSQYFQWKYRMPAWKRKLNFATAPGDESLFDFVMAEHGLPRVVEFLNGWAQEASRIRRLHVVRYEDMRKNPARVLDQVLDYLGTPGDGEHVAAAVEFGRFDNLKELERRKAFRGGRMRPADPDNPESYKVRRGKVGGYRDYFDHQQVAVIDQLTSSTLSPFYGYPDTYPADRAVCGGYR
jgi:alcohol sulfotransferase